MTTTVQASKSAVPMLAVYWHVKHLPIRLSMPNVHSTVGPMLNASIAIKIQVTSVFAWMATQVMSLFGAVRLQKIVCTVVPLNRNCTTLVKHSNTSAKCARAQRHWRWSASQSVHHTQTLLIWRTTVKRYQNHLTQSAVK